jgi:hypothetical protein
MKYSATNKANISARYLPLKFITLEFSQASDQAFICLGRKITTTIHKTVQAAKRFQIVLTEEIRAICPLYMPLDKCPEMCGDELATRYEIAAEVITALENQAVSQGAAYRLKSGKVIWRNPPRPWAPSEVRR